MGPAAPEKRSYIGYGGPACPACGHVFPPPGIRSGTRVCPRCRRDFEAIRFDPVEPAVELRSDPAGVDGGAPCSRHEGNAAVASCGRCGQFMCGLCRTEVEGRLFCPPCFDRVTSEGTLAGTATKLRNWWGLAALMFAVGDLFLMTMFLSPLAFIFAILGAWYCTRGLKEKHSREEPNWVWLYFVLLVLTALQLAGSVIIPLGVYGNMF